MFQRLKVCQELARKIVSQNNDRSIEDLAEYFNTKVKNDRVLLKEHNFLHKNKKLAETFKGLFRVTQVN